MEWLGGWEVLLGYYGIYSFLGYFSFQFLGLEFTLGSGAW
jgi:hypothetical protein